MHNNVKGFRFYIFVLGTAISLLTTVLIALFAYQRMQTIITGQFDKTVREISRNYAFNTRAGIITQIPSLLTEATMVLLNEHDFLYLIVYDDALKELYSVHADSLEEALRYSSPRETDEYFSKEQSIAYGVQKNKRHCIDAWRTVYDVNNTRIVGFVRLGASMEQLDLARRDIIQSIVLFSLIVTMLVVCLTYFFSGGVIKPVTALSMSISEIIKSGDFSQRAVVNTFVLEINTLKNAFNELITNIGAKERTIHDHVNNLETKVTEKTKSLMLANDELKSTVELLKNTQSKLIHSEKLAGIGQLAAGVAHEINNPIGFITSNTDNLVRYVIAIKRILELFRSDASAEDIKAEAKAVKLDFIMSDIDELLKENKEGLARVAKIVQNLRNFARIDQADKYAETDINAALQSALIMANNEIKYHADVRTQFGEISPVLCDAGEINQVFLNIIVNAAQAIREQKREEKGTIEIRTFAEGDNIICLISDDGPGVAESIVSQIFNPFFTTKEVGKGTGLGLSISYDIIVNKHGGMLSVERSESGGAAFRIEVPIKRSGANE